MQILGEPCEELNQASAWLSSSPPLPPGFPLQSWVFTKGQGKGPPMPTNRGGPGEPVEGVESTAIEVEDIPALLRDVARFAEAVEKLKDVVLAEGTYPGGPGWGSSGGRAGRLVIPGSS